MNSNLIKLAFQYGYKQADALSDFFGQASPVNYVAPPISAAASFAGLISPTTEEDEEEMDRHPVRPWLIPGLASYQNARRLGRQLKGHRFSSVLGAGTSVLASIGAGAGLGALVGGLTDGREGIASGAMLGSGLGALGGAGASLAGALGAAITPRRTEEKQEKYRKSPKWKDYLIPGHAMYNTFKSYGVAFGRSKARAGRIEEKKKMEDEIKRLRNSIEAAKLRRELEQLKAQAAKG